jgi:hypothetical protein
MSAKLAVVGAVTAGLVAVGGVAVVTAQAADPPRPWLCASEGVDVGPCVWDAQAQGNGQGRSFFLDAEGNVTPLPQK